MKTALQSQQHREVTASQIDVPKEIVRQTPNKDADDKLAANVKLFGIIQPLAVVPNGKRFTLVDGTRRLDAAQANEIERVPVIVNYPPKGLNTAELKEYRKKLRHLLHNRQDLTISQWVETTEQAQKEFGMTAEQIAPLLGCDPATVSNRKRIKHYHPQIVQMIDREELSLFHAQSLDGLKPVAQLKVFKTMREDFAATSGRRLQSLVRKRFDPRKYPELWIEPGEATAKIVGRKAKRERLIKARRKPFSAADRHRLENNLDILRAEYEENKKELDQKNLLLRLVGPIHRAFSNDLELMDKVAQKYPQWLEALEAFSEHGY